MTRDEFNAFCGGLPHTTHVVQWGNSDVWKVGGKLFAVCGWSDDDRPAFTFKVTPMVFEIMRGVKGIRPAPYLASRGMSWLQVHGDGPTDAEIEDHLRTSYDLVIEGLPKKIRTELGL